MASSWSSTGCQSACASLGELRSCLLQFKSDLIHFREIRMKRDSCFRSFLDEAVVRSGEDAEVKSASSQLLGEPQKLAPGQKGHDCQATASACNVQEGLSDCGTDPDMPELQPITPRCFPPEPVEDDHMRQCSLSDTDSNEFHGDSPLGKSHGLGNLSGGDFNKCWGRNSLRDALKGLDEVDDSEEKDEAQA
eukprot:TRINITY_DN79415_c0_g1_i1.p1 TRINITY_DN79415_c0_g1~~TRINITY_DN79415_c0_g1_i1.p1  ORF type:complete len:192 (+),score=34.29 TRINITY_DN79415_c0_g1_i1:35-610(+)